METIQRVENALTKAAKYICTQQCGKCPMMLENFPCPEECGIETLPWKCWVNFFKNTVPEAEINSELGE